MITSMTGFGRGEATIGNFSATVELRSVNSRYLEISGNWSKRFSDKEHLIREQLRSKIARGKLSMTIDIRKNADEQNTASTGLMANMDTVNAYYTTLLEIRKQLKFKDAVKLEHILMCPGLFSDNTRQEANEDEWTAISSALSLAIDALNTMRVQEGKELARDMYNRMKEIEKTILKVEKMSQERIPAERQRLRERVARLFESDEIDEQRLEMEVVLLADKLDVSEECVRMKSHMKFFAESLKSGDQPGRKINFLLQEMNREINTIGSKANDAAISQMIVGVKEELERIREQVQNIE